MAANFRDLINAHRFDRGLITVEEERALLRAGTARHGLTLDQARGAVLETAGAGNLPLQSRIEDEVGRYLQNAAGPRLALRRADFQSAVELYRAKARGALPTAEIQSRVRMLAERMNLMPRRAGLLRTRGWFNRIPPAVNRPVPDFAEGAAPTAAGPGNVVPANTPAGASGPVMAGDEAGLRAALDAWARAVNARRRDLVLPLYRQDAVLLATLEDDILTGPAAIGAYFDSFLARPGLNVTFGPARFWSDRASGGASGIYVFTWLAADGVTRMRAPARFTYVYARAPNGWLILQHHSSLTPETPIQPAIGP